ncbi:hypothetical protein [Algiphilus sp.]|uniref:hypothetical protein n=1 Tax=Algiphilus sp. TaxID=1872431 RepID=UPI003C6814D4
MSAAAHTCDQVDEIPAGEERPVRYLVRLQDHGQDFLEWSLDDRGNVVDCGPFQGWHWCRYRVINPLDNLRSGHVLWLVPRDEPMAEARTLNYPVAEVREVLS